MHIGSILTRKDSKVTLGHGIRLVRNETAIMIMMDLERVNEIFVFMSDIKFA